MQTKSVYALICIGIAFLFFLFLFQYKEGLLTTIDTSANASANASASATPGLGFNPNELLFSSIESGLIEKVVTNLSSLSLSDLNYPSTGEFIKDLLKESHSIPYGADATASSIQGYYASLSTKMAEYKTSPQIIKYIQKVSQSLANQISLQIDKAISSYDTTIQETYLNPASSPFVSNYF